MRQSRDKALGGRHAVQDAQRKDMSGGSMSSEAPSSSPYQQSPMHPVDPLMQEREEFKAALLSTQKLAKISVSPARIT